MKVWFVNVLCFRKKPGVILMEKQVKAHKIRIQICQGDEEKKFMILGFGYVI